MVNEEVTKEAMQAVKEGVTVAIQVGKELIKLNAYLDEKLSKVGYDLSKLIPKSSEMKLKDLYKQGQLQEIYMKDTEQTSNPSMETIFTTRSYPKSTFYVNSMP
jgi:hypothetical protein